MTEAQDRITALIKDLDKEIKIVGNTDEQTILMIEDTLKISLPESYKWFLRQYSLLMMPNYIIYGVGSIEEPACLKLTIGVREKGLPAALVVIENDNDGRILCLDTARTKGEDCPIVSWATQGGKVSDAYPGFYDLLETKLKDTLLGRQTKVPQIGMSGYQR
jgi:hypothetical protein